MGLLVTLNHGGVAGGYDTRASRQSRMGFPYQVKIGAESMYVAPEHKTTVIRSLAQLFLPVHCNYRSLEQPKIMPSFTRKMQPGILKVVWLHTWFSLVDTR